MAKLRKLGDILLDIEPYLLEMADHDLQWGDFHSLLAGYLEVHLPNHQEEYNDGTRPVRYYGHKDKLKELCEKKRSRK